MELITKTEGGREKKQQKKNLDNIGNILKKAASNITNIWQPRRFQRKKSFASFERFAL